MKSNTLVTAILGAVVGAGAMVIILPAVQDAPTNFHKCMLREMRGQDRTVYGTVSKVCQRRWKEPFDLVQEGSLVWSTNTSGGITISAAHSFPREQELASASVSFATVDCKAAQAGDLKYTFKNEIAHFGMIVIVWSEPMPPVCMRTLSVKARYR